MATVFNKFGVVNDVDIFEFDEEIALKARGLFKSLAAMGVPPVEIRAVCQFLVSTIETEMAGELLKYQYSLRDTKKVEVGPRRVVA